MFSAATSRPVLADQLTFGGGGCTPVNVSSGAASYSCTPFSSSALTVTAQGAGNLATGAFGTYSVVADSGGIGLGSGADSGSYFTVTYDFGGLGITSGTAAFDIIVSGLLSINTGTSNAEFEYVGETGTINSSPLPAGGTPLASGGSEIVIDTPISDGTTELTFSLVLTTDCAGVQQCTSIADFLDPTTITGASAYDSSGNLVSATFVSESGFNPNAVPVSAPEPSSILCLGAGLLVVFAPLVLCRGTLVDSQVARMYAPVIPVG